MAINSAALVLLPSLPRTCAHNLVGGLSILRKLNVQ